MATSHAFDRHLEMMLSEDFDLNDNPYNRPPNDDELERMYQEYIKVKKIETMYKMNKEHPSQDKMIRLNKVS